MGPAPTLFVLDLTVGQHVSCWAALDRLAHDPYLGLTPVVVCATASWLLAGHTEALARPGVFVWREPFDPAELLHTVEMIQGPTRVDAPRVSSTRSMSIAPSTAISGSA